MKRRKAIKGKRLRAPTAVRSKEGLRKIFRVCTKQAIKLFYIQKT